MDTSSPWLCESLRVHQATQAPDAFLLPAAAGNGKVEFREIFEALSNEDSRLARELHKMNPVPKVKEDAMRSVEDILGRLK